TPQGACFPPISPSPLGGEAEGGRGSVTLKPAPIDRTTLKEPLTLRKLKSLRTPFWEMDEEEYITELKDCLPNVTRFTLRELDVDEILSNLQLRHDLHFDPHLQFKPNTDGPLGELKLQLANTFWSNLNLELSQNQQFHRLPLLLFETKCILLELLPPSTQTSIMLNELLDPPFLTQQLQHGVLDPQSIFTPLLNLLASSCAPARDPLIDTLKAQCEKKEWVGVLRGLFELLEVMKLDVANHQLLKLRGFVVEHQVEFEWECVKEQYEAEDSEALESVREWMDDAYSSLQKSGKVKPSMHETFARGLIQTLQNPPPASASSPNSQTSSPGSSSTPPAPPIFQLDTTRLQTLHSDSQDLCILSTLLLLFRQLAGPKCTPPHLKTLKKILWTLLNDADTSLSHVSLEMHRRALELRGGGNLDLKMVEGLVERSLGSGSKVYQVVVGKVFKHVEAVVGRILDSAPGKLEEGDLVKDGLGEVGEELMELAGKVGVWAKFLGGVYKGILVDSWEVAKKEAASKSDE
ncbi:hypothetical protein HDV05_008165, partial [Chytridiales sp. JEL 0842]